jgi:outer membrane protein
MSTSSFAQGRIGIVDLRKLFDNYWKTKQADANLKERATDLDKEYKGLRDEYTKSKEEVQKLLANANDQAVSQEERDKRKKTAEGKLKDLKDTEETIVQFEKQARTTLDEQRKRMRDNILTEIRNLVNAKAKALGYSLVIDVAAETANNTPVILYTNGENDMTQNILEQLNLGAPADIGKTTEKPAESSNGKSPKPSDKK